MSRAMTAGLVLLVGMAGISCNTSGADAGTLRAVSDQAVTGLTFPESVGCDPSGKALYVSQFGGGSLLVVGFKSDKEPKGIYSVSAKGEIKELAKDIGRLDGVYEMKDGTILATDWNSGSLFSWSVKDGKQTLASGFKGPADFCVIPDAKGYLVVVPDLVKSEVRIIRLGK